MIEGGLLAALLLYREVAMNKASESKGRDISAPIEQITIDGNAYKLVYNNHAARVAEDVYEQYYGQDVGYGEIIQRIARGKYAAIMALFYGAMVAGGCDMEWREFDANFKLDSVDGIREIILRGLEKSLPQVEKSYNGDEDDKTDP